jgi:hypothetical protein
MDGEAKIKITVARVSNHGQKRNRAVGLIVLSQTVAVIEAENQVIEEIQYLAIGGPDESRSEWR